MHKICLDPGHGFSNVKMGRYDPGAVADGVAEADVALQFALTLKWVLGRAGAEVFLTRDDDRDSVPVWKRDDLAREAGCTHFLALHCNAGPVTASGTETYYRDAPDLDWARVVQQAALAMGMRDRGVKHESATRHKRLAVLNFGPPACLLELGFLTSPLDRRKLVSRESRLAFASALLKALSKEPGWTEARL